MRLGWPGWAGPVHSASLRGQWGECAQPPGSQGSRNAKREWAAPGPRLLPALPAPPAPGTLGPRAAPRPQGHPLAEQTSREVRNKTSTVACAVGTVSPRPYVTMTAHTLSERLHARLDTAPRQQQRVRSAQARRGRHWTRATGQQQPVSPGGQQGRPRRSGLEPRPMPRPQLPQARSGRAGGHT